MSIKLPNVLTQLLLSALVAALVAAIGYAQGHLAEFGVPAAYMLAAQVALTAIGKALQERNPNVTIVRGLADGYWKRVLIG